MSRVGFNTEIRQKRRDGARMPNGDIGADRRYRFALFAGGQRS
jgi:hypothetical protein